MGEMGFEEDDGLANHMSNLQLHNHMPHNMISPNTAQNANEIVDEQQGENFESIIYFKCKLIYLSYL
jgi:hypothetical protein